VAKIDEHKGAIQRSVVNKPHGFSSGGMFKDHPFGESMLSALTTKNPPFPSSYIEESGDRSREANQSYDAQLLSQQGPSGNFESLD
jgi:hypothetical protein